MSKAAMEAPWKAGARAVRDNALPSLLILTAATALVVSYYHVEVVKKYLDMLGQLNASGPWVFAAVMTAFSAGFIPWCVRMCFKKIRPAHPLLDLIHSTLWWAFMGLVVSSFYNLQSYFFGNEVSFSTVGKKVLLDQFAFSILIGAPFNAISHYWKDHQWSMAELGHALRPGWYRRLIVPNLLPNFLVWLPGNCIFYSMPPDLQLPVANCIGCFWALMCVRIATHSRGASAIPHPSHPAA